MHKIKGIVAEIVFIVVTLIIIGIIGHYKKNQYIVLEFGIFSGNAYDVPNTNVNSYQIVDEAIEEFQKLHPKIKIKYSRVGTLKNDYPEWLSGKIIEGKEPDIFVVQEGDFNTFASIGIMKDLGPLISKDKYFDISRMYDNAVRSGQLDGVQYALPREVEPTLMFVNKTLLEKENIEMPKHDWTWEDFYEICKRVTKDTDGDGKIDQFGTVDFTWEDGVYTNGQQLFTNDGKKALFTQPEVIDAIEFVKELNALNQNMKVTIDDFDKGKVAFRPFPFSWYRVYKSYPYRIIRYDDFEWECVKLPRGPNGNNASDLHSFLIGISSRTKYEKEAWEFLKFMVYNPQSQMNVFKYSQGVPALREVTESKDADEELRRYNPDEELAVDTRVLGEVIEQSIVTPRFHKYEKAMDMADKAIYQIIYGEDEIEKTLEKLNEDLNEFLN